jgi:hypothetical protein
LKENPETGEAGWMLSGAIAGGMTAEEASAMPEDIQTALENPFSEVSVYDPELYLTLQIVAASDKQQGTAGAALDLPLQVMVRDHRLRPAFGEEVTFTIIKGGGSFPNDQKEVTVKTDAGGIARAPLTLGRSTADNPVDLWLPEEKYPHQAGENVVEATLTSGSGKEKIRLTAYALPGEPVKMVKLKSPPPEVHILAKDFISVLLLDQYDNPVANREVVFTAHNALARPEFANYINPHARSVLLVPEEDPCHQPDFATYNDCLENGGPTLKALTRKGFGAAAHYFAGEIPYTEYYVDAVYRNMTQTFTLRTRHPPEASGGSPLVMFESGTSYFLDEKGNILDAAKVGKEIRLKVYMRALIERSGPGEKTHNCSGGALTCPTLASTKSYYSSTDFEADTINYYTEWGSQDGTPFVHEGKGVFTAPYTVEEGLNTLYIKTRCSVNVPRDKSDCSGCAIREEEVFSNRNNSFSMHVTGVDIRLDIPDASPQEPGKIPVPVDENGEVDCDTPITFTIHPLEYKASAAYMLLHKNDNLFSYTPVENQGEGSAVIPEGLRFEPDDRWEMELVLNYGTGSEIRSDRFQLEPAPLTTGDQGFTLRRTHSISQFDRSAPGSPAPEFIDDYRLIPVDLPADRKVAVKLLDKDKVEKAVLIPQSILSKGRHYFIVDYAAVADQGFDPVESPDFIIEVFVDHPVEDCRRKVHHAGRLEERSIGDMMGQLLLYDVRKAIFSKKRIDSGLRSVTNTLPRTK